MSDRKLVTEEELLEILNEGLRKYPEYKACRFDAIRKIIPKDPAACNWSSARKSCGGPPEVDCKLVASRIITDAKIKYNVR